MTEVLTSGSAVRVEHVSAGHEVVISGRLDVHTVGDVRRLLHAALAAGSGDLLLHLGEAEVYDATALGMVVGVHHQAARIGRRLVLMDVSARLDRLLRSSRLGRVLVREYPTVALRVVPATV